MEIEHDKPKKQFVLWDEPHTRIGEIQYKSGGHDDLYALHTEVFPPYEGQGYATRLLDALVAYAKLNSLKIIPICPYVIAAFKKYPEKYAPVIKQKRQK